MDQETWNRRSARLKYRSSTPAGFAGITRTFAGCFTGCTSERMSRIAARLALASERTPPGRRATVLLPRDLRGARNPYIRCWYRESSWTSSGGAPAEGSPLVVHRRMEERRALVVRASASARVRGSPGTDRSGDGTARTPDGPPAAPG